MRSTSGLLHPSEATNSSGGDQGNVFLHNPSPSAALPAGERRTVAAPTSIYRHDYRETMLKYTYLNFAKLQLLELPGPSESIATGTVIDVLHRSLVLTNKS